MKHAVIGAGFGDEGKGMVVDYLCRKLKKPLVVRYCGGQQAGHQVVTKDGRDHVFSNFGSGTLYGAPTYWDSWCTVDPIGIINELTKLSQKGVSPKLYIDKACPVTTPHDMYHNQEHMEHGSCGLGINATYRREENHYSLLFEDIFFPSVLKKKLELIQKYYNNKENLNLDDFLYACSILRDCDKVKISASRDIEFKNVIFEGSQGLLLDQNYGFFPHVTPSNTGTRNISEYSFFPWLVTRAYCTRHGNGPHPTEDIPHNIKPNPYEKNIDDLKQGKFRIGLLNVDWLMYGINKDDILARRPFNLVITCLDCVENEWRYVEGGQIVCCNNEKDFVQQIVTTLRRRFKVAEVFISHSPVGSELKLFRA